NFDLQTPRSPVVRQGVGVSYSFSIGQKAGPVTGRLRADHDEPPRLRLSDRGCAVPRIETVGQKLGWNRIRPKAANVAASRDHLGHGCLGRVFHSPTAGIDGSLENR